MVYLDNAATTKVFDEVLELSTLINDKYWFNQNSNHAAGVSSLEIYNSAISIINEKLHLNDQFNLSFSNNASTCIWIGIHAVLKANKQIKKIMFATIDHASSKNTAKKLADKYEIIEMPLINGYIDCDFLAKNVDADTLVLYNVVNSEIGLIQDYQKINDIVHQKNGIVFGDAVQALCKVDINYKSFDVFVISGHKINTLKIGMIATHKDLKCETFKEKETTLNIGTINTLNVACLARALKIHATMPNNLAQLNKKMRNYCNEKGYNINSPESGVPHIINFSLNKIVSENAINFLSQNEVYISASSACSSKEPTNVGVVQQIHGFDRAKSSVRISFSKTTTEAELDVLFTKLEEMERFFN